MSVTSFRSNPLAACLVLLSLGCSGGGSTGSGAAQGNGPTSVEATAQLTGAVKVDGSSTVFPITEAVAEEFQGANPNVRVTVGVSGTGGGFKKFSAGETDVSNASRAIKEPEKQACAAKGIEFLEFKIAYDGLAVIVNPQNSWVDSLSVEQLRLIWQPDSAVAKWSDVNPAWPDHAIKLYGPGTDSGTFDYFTEVVNGKEKACRPDFTASEDDNVLVTGIAADKYALGYFGYAYYAENEAKLKLLAIDGGAGPVKPSSQTVRAGEYKPLARPLFIYVAKASLARPEVAAFVRFYLANAESLVREVKYVPVTSEEAAQNLQTLEAALGTLDSKN
jgi:phosphate transport system substrate-binding protein